MAALMRESSLASSPMHALRLPTEVLRMQQHSQRAATCSARACA